MRLQTRITRNRLNFERGALIIALVLVCMVGLSQCGSAEQPKQLVQITHIVATGETLHGIAEQYCPPDRYILEFREGIYELNYDTVFHPRELQGVAKMTVFPGDRLQINFWVKGSEK